MTKREKADNLIANFETVLKNAGFQDKNGKAKKPYYFRNHIQKGFEKGEIVMRWSLTDIMARMADNEDYIIEVFINGVIFINSLDGFSNNNYKTLAIKLEEEMKKEGWSVVYTFENEFDLIGSNNSITYASNIEFRKIGG